MQGYNKRKYLNLKKEETFIGKCSIIIAKNSKALTKNLNF